MKNEAPASLGAKNKDAKGSTLAEKEQAAMVNAHPHDEGQVIDFVAARAARPAPAKLTPELIEAAGVKVVDTAPSDPAPKDDLVGPSHVSKSEVLQQGTEAMARLADNRSRDWADWLKVLAALGIGRHAAMVEAGVNAPRGRGYCTAFAKWLRCHEAFQAIDQADRKHMFNCLDNLEAIEEWRAGLSRDQQLKLNYPATVLARWKKSHRSPPHGRDDDRDGHHDGHYDDPPLLPPQELRRQLEVLGLSRFRREVMPEDWCSPLRDTALSLATPEQLIVALERKCSPSKNNRAALKSLRKSQPNS